MTRSILSSDDATLHETLRVLHERRKALRMFAGLGAMSLLSRNALACTLIPSETAGLSGRRHERSEHPHDVRIVRSDIRSSIGTASGTAAGTVASDHAAAGEHDDEPCGAERLAVYLWHCNATGGYSMYSSGVTNQNYLRGVATDANGLRPSPVFSRLLPGRRISISRFTRRWLPPRTGRTPCALQPALPEAASRQVLRRTNQSVSEQHAVNSIRRRWLPTTSQQRSGVDQLATVAAQHRTATRWRWKSARRGRCYRANDIPFQDGFGVG